MGLFGPDSPFDVDVDKATSEKNTEEQWGVIMNICDKVGASSKNAKDCLRSIMRRLGHLDPHVAVQALTLLDACINNCGKSFHLEIASREFETEFRKLLSKVQPPVAKKMRLSLKKWAESEFKKDSELDLIPSLYVKLRGEGHDFTDSTGTPAKSVAPLSKDPNVVSSQKEQDDIALAIELSLKEKGGRSTSPKQTSSGASNTPYSAIYPSMLSSGTATSSSGTAKPVAGDEKARKVRALYDFEAAEDNELTFLAGEIIHVVDDSDANWWKGFNQRGEGLFPSNFVTADLSIEPENLEENKKASAAALSSALELTEAAKIPSFAEPAVIEIDEEKIERLLHLLHEANPEDPSQDSDEMLQLETRVNQMQPLIDSELERVDRKHAQLTQLSSDLVEAINLYHTLMREQQDRGQAPYLSRFGMRPGSSQSDPNSGMYGTGYQHPPPHLSSGGMQGLAHNMHAMSLAGGHFPQHQQHPQMMPGSYATMPGQMPNHMPLHMQNGHPGNVHPHPGINGMGLQSSQHQPPASVSTSIHQQLPQHPQSHSQPHMMTNPNVDPNMPPSSLHQIHQQLPSNTMQQQQPPITGAPQQSMANNNNNNPQYSMGSPGYFVQNYGGPAIQQQQLAPGQQPPQQQPPMYLPHPQQLQHPSPQQLQQHQQQNQQLPNNGASPNHQLHMMANMAAITQPVTNTILPPADSRANIPIYQQQR